MEEPKSTIVTVPQLVDLALNSPEIGIVNFTIMHSLLHVMVHQLQLTDCSVEFRGSDSDRLQNYIKTAKPGPIIALKEYIIGGETPITIETPEKGQVDEASPEKPPEEASKTVIVVEPSKQDNDQQTTFSVGISQDQYHKLMKDMDDVKEQVKELNDLPGNIGLLDAIRTPTAPVQEMFNLMSMNKKVDAHEITLKKLSTLIEDLILEKKGEGPLVDIIDFNESDMDALKKQVKKLEEQVIDINKWRKDEQNRTVKTSDAKEPTKDAKEVKIPLTHLSTKMEYKVVVPSDNNDTKAHLDALYENLVQMNDTYQEHFKDIDIEMSNLKEMTMWNTGVMMDDKTKEKTKSKMISSASIPTLFSKMSNAPNLSQITQVIPVELTELPKKVKLLEGTLTTTNDMTQILWDERPAKQALMDMVKETVDILKNLKADREEIEEALQEKADTCMLETLVTKIDFAAVQQDLLHLLDVANQKLQQQENFYQEQITIIYEEINKKMEIGELDDLKEQINAKMKIVNDKLKVLLDVKNETEAAGGKMRFVKNLTCLSCDKEVIMRREVDSNSFPKAAALPGPKSMGAYLAYELDQMRKQRKCSQNAKSLNLLEHALHSRHDTSKLQTDHICNRYCGGSHTKVTSGQKVTRLGHFLNQWDPDEGGIVDEIIRGTDGKAYKAQADVSKN